MICKISKAKMVGSSHKVTNVVCQDSIFVSKRKDLNLYSIALSDGAGSCKYSHYGSKISTQTVSSIFMNDFQKLSNMKDSHLSKYIINKIGEKFIEKSNKLKSTPKELSSTLLFIVIKDNKYIAGHIGDGLIGTLNNGNLSILSYPENGEYSNSTYFVTNKNAHKYLRIYRGDIDSKTSFILMSDGTSETLYDKKNSNLAKANEIFCQWLDVNSEQKMDEILKNNLENIISRKTHDDCSIVIATINL